MIHLILIRHGQTVANIEGRWIGQGESELTTLGRAQIAATARRLATEVRDGVGLYTSPLARTLETAEEIGRALGLTPVVMDDLREIHFGALEGIRLDELKEQHPQVYARWQEKENTAFTWPGGECRADFFRRIATACQTILARHERGSVLIVGHGGTIRSCLMHLLPETLGKWWTYEIDNCGLTHLEVEGRQARLLALNDTTHLPK